MTKLTLKSAVAALALASAAPAVMAADLVVGLRAGPDSIDPHWSTLGSQAEALRHVFDTLVDVDEKLQLKPGLAVSWEPIDDTTWEFKMREGVKFHDGTDFTAEDAKFSIERIPEVTGPMPMTLYTKYVDSVEVVDDYTLHVKTKGMAPSLPNDFTRLFVVPSETGMEAGNEEFNSGEKAIGTGPYTFVSWQPKGDLVLKRNDDYWGGETAWETVTRREIPEDTSRVAALRSGEVDLINYVPASDYLAMKNDDEIDTFVSDSIYILNIAPSVKDEEPQPIKVNGEEVEGNPLQDLRVRKALDLAINRDVLVNVVLEGLGTPANQLMPEGFFGYSPELGKREYDIEKAKELLAEAGYPDGFEIDFTCTNNRVPGDAVVCEALAQMWSRLGLTVNAQALNGTVFFPAAAREEYTMTMSAWGTLTGEAAYTYGALVHTKDAEKGFGNFNRSGYSNPEFDKVFGEGSQTLEPEARKKLYEEASFIAMDDRALIPTVILQTVWAANADTIDMTARVDQETRTYAIKPVE
ncbi:ABC transporter substrate-binding protein [Sulfitobacter sp. S0837]|uniref:ABC transporter substrate-binding protein n=1 Tax=Sulfitobacter maritimus TaxID=2741719 RepID=UPI001584102D|nr:ABC transporter substrate-binding protein [Sulfitobacter maritimus]NUH63741.1 ABC transporter substrate-binding protein [Sulfitobacter maritimus]NUH63785.1 ABC transporter substrate-binding protein [Sulfitobacter maritimus]NUH65588.1 ABC transporter substrate-binding protein [Sulfitobacter maritimus]